MERELFISAELWKDASDSFIIQKEIRQKIDEEHYSIKPFTRDIDSIAIVINYFPVHMLKAGWGKPRKYISYQRRSADIRLPVPYDEYINGDHNHKYLMTVKNIVDSIRIIGEKCHKAKRAEFDSDGMIDDILRKLEISQNDLENIVGVIPDDIYNKIVSE